MVAKSGQDSLILLFRIAFALIFLAFLADCGTGRVAEALNEVQSSANM